MANLLIVEDDRSLRDLLAEVLREAGHEVQVAANGVEASRLFARHGADLVITDIFMPGMDGIEIIMELRQQVPSPKIIAISSGGVLRQRVAGVESNYDVLDDAKLAGADRILYKPFDLAVLLQTTSELLSA